MRLTLPATAAATFIFAMPALAQPAADRGAADPAGSASLEHSAMKATTFKVGTTVANLAVLSYATGGIVGGVVLSTLMLGSSWALYTANDYLWDSYAPPPARQSADQTFDTTGDAWRNTLKFMTYKPVIASIKLASLYAYTGSVQVAGVFGTAAILINSGVFYANNMAWDLYDWYTGTPPTVDRSNLAIADNL